MSEWEDTCPDCLRESEKDMKPGISSSAVGGVTKLKGSWTSEPWTAVIDEPVTPRGTRTYICAPTKQFVLVGEEAEVKRASQCVNVCAGLNPSAYRACVEA